MTGKIVKCSYCETDLYVPMWRLRKSKTHFCNNKCKGLYKTLPRILKRCEYTKCNNIFESLESSHQRFCSDVCSRMYVGELNKNGEYVMCKQCGTEIYKQQYELYKNNHYCSNKCYGDGLRLERIEVTCSLDGCDGIILLTQHEIDKRKKLNKRVFCSVECSSKFGLMTIQNNPIKNTHTKPECEFAELLDNHNIEYKWQYWVNWKNGWKKWYDFYIPSHNMLIEIDGTYWHGKGLLNNELNKQQHTTRMNDILKNELAAQRGYTLTRVWSDEIKMFNVNIITNE